MLFTTRVRYALIVAVDLMDSGALHDQNHVERVVDIANRQKLTVAYLEQILLRLRRGSIVVSIRGPGGGYKLARDSSKISALDVVYAVGENIEMNRCSECRSIGRIPTGKDKCATHDLWNGLNVSISNYFSDMKLIDLKCITTVSS